MNYGYDSVNCFTLILCGESHLNAILRKPVHEALRQRISVHYNYQGLSNEESTSYIIHKLNCAGSSKAIISEAALSAVAGHTHGNPRLIDNLMTDALAIGEQQGKKCKKYVKCRKEDFKRHKYISVSRPKEECEKLEQGYFSFAMWLSFKGT